MAFCAVKDDGSTNSFIPSPLALFLSASGKWAALVAVERTGKPQ